MNVDKEQREKYAQRPSQLEQRKVHSFKQLECLLIQRGFVRLEKLSCAFKFSLWYRGDLAYAWLKHFASKKARDFSPIILAQTDTTAGFLSLDKHRLNRAKNRQEDQETLRTFGSFADLMRCSRVPNAHKRFIRQASKISTILPNKKSFRVVKDPLHMEFLRYFGGLYSTSANRTKEPFSLEFALQVADIIALDSRGLYEDKPSAIYRLSRTRKRRAR